MFVFRKLLPASFDFLWIVVREYTVRPHTTNNMIACMICHYLYLDKCTAKLNTTNQAPTAFRWLSLRDNIESHFRIYAYSDSVVVALRR